MKIYFIVQCGPASLVKVCYFSGEFGQYAIFYDKESALEKFNLLEPDHWCSFQLHEYEV